MLCGQKTQKKSHNNKENIHTPKAQKTNPTDTTVQNPHTINPTPIAASSLVRTSHMSVHDCAQLTVTQNTAENSSHNLPSYLPTDQCCL